MKQWLNNWEKIIGDRLRRAQTRPDSHVWDLIEAELDQQAVKRRPAVFRIATVAGIAALLLLSIAGAFWSTSPNGHLAYTFNSPESIYPETESTYWVITSDFRAENGIEGIEVSGNVSQTIASAETVAADDQREYAATATAAVEPVVPATDVEERTTSIKQLNDVELADEAITNILIEEISLQPEQKGLQLHPSIDMQVSVEKLDVLQSSIRPRGQELLNRIASSTKLENDLLVRADDPELNTLQNISQLTSQSSGQMQDFAGQDLSGDLVFDESLMVLSEDEEMIAAVMENTVKEEIIETVVLEKKAAWITEALNDLETWKTSLSEQTEKNEELEELIAEAVIDEEDPLTKRQNATKDLYRAHNINKGFHIGVVTGFTSNWVTTASRNPEINRNYVDYRFNGGYQVGLNMGYDITEHFGLMAEIKYSDEGGSYYHPVKKKHQQIDLRYVELPIYAKVKHSILSEKMRPLVFNYIVGVTYKDLRTINVSNDGKDQRFGQDYNTSEWGLSAGFDFDFYINKNFFWTVGTRLGFSGATDTFPRFKGEDGEGPMSVSAGLYTRFNFRLPGK